MPIVDITIPYIDGANIDVDAAVDEPAWQQALMLDEFLTFAPTYDQQPTGGTFVRVLADERGLWFHITNQDPDPERIRAGLGRRDTRWQDDWVAVYIDPTGKGQRSYLFMVNPLGVQADGVNVSGAEENPAWDGRWPSAARRTADGYNVEFGVPWRAIRHPAIADDIGLIVCRHIGRSGEKSSWPRLDPEIVGLLLQQGVVGGPGALPKNVGLDVIPEVTFGWDDDGPNDDRIGVGGVSPGVTVKYAPSATLQLLGTFNPDFSQVESDKSQIDINRRYALFLEEKRPFFLDGQEWFTHSFPGSLFYTRSMVAPIYGLRATAEGGGWTVASLHVLDAHPGPTVNELGGWSKRDIGAAPALETVVRARRAVGADSFVGAALSDRTMVGTDLYNRLGGLDARIRLSDRWFVSGSGLGSVTSGIGESLAPAGEAWLSYGSKYLGWDVWGDAIHPDFRTENGYLTQTDRIGGGTSVTLNAFTQSALLPKLQMNPLQGVAAWNTAADLRELLFDPGISLVFGNGGDAWIGYLHEGELFGGKFLIYDQGVIETNQPWTRWLTTGSGLTTGTAPLYDSDAPNIGWQDNIWMLVRFQPFRQLSAECTGTWERFVLDQHEMYNGWVGRLRVEAYASRRVWVRGILDRSTFAGTVRGEGFIAWEQSPGSAVYFGGSWTGGDPSAAMKAGRADIGWQVFAKGSWVFTL